VLGLERFVPPHEMGSSHGLSRIIRLTYFEHPSYVPLLRRAYELWRELEQLTGEQLLYITGALEIGAPNSVVVEGSLKSAEIHDLPHEIFTAAQAMRRFPAYRLPAEFTAILQPMAVSSTRAVHRGRTSAWPGQAARRYTPGKQCWGGADCRRRARVERALILLGRASRDHRRFVGLQAGS